MKINRYTWIILIALTMASYFSSKAHFSAITVFSLLAILIVKCSLVGFQFMELQKANLFWKVAFISIIGLFSMIVSVITLA